MWRRAVDDVGAEDASGKGIDGSAQLGNHALIDLAAVEHLVDLVERQVGDKRILIAKVLVQTVDIGQEDGLVRMERRRNGTGGGIGVDVKEAAVLPCRDRRDNGDVLAIEQALDIVGVDVRDFTHATELGVERLGDKRTGIAAGHAHGKVAVVVERRDQLLVDLTAQHLAHNIHGRRRGHALPVLKLDGDVVVAERLVDGLAATVHDNRAHTDNLEQDDVAHHVAT